MFDDELDFFEDSGPSRWFRKLVFLGIGAAVAYFYAQYRAKQTEISETLTSSSSFKPVTQEPKTPESDGWHKLSPSPAPVEPEPEPEPEAEAEAAPGLVAEAVVDVAAAEVTIVEEYVLEDDEIGEDDEIDLALEEDIENGDIDEDDDYEVEGLLTEADSEEDEEQLLEPSPRSDNPMWVSPVGGKCPDGYPIKARFSTGRYHLPADRGYRKIVPDCCYESEEDAQADGFTHSRWS